MVGEAVAALRGRAPQQPDMVCKPRIQRAEILRVNLFALGDVVLGAVKVAVCIFVCKNICNIESRLSCKDFAYDRIAEALNVCFFVCPS